MTARRSASRKTFHTLTASIAAIFLATALPALALPEMDLQQPLGTSVPDGGSKNFGTVEQGSSGALVFTILNTGTTALTLTGNPQVAISGANAADFTVTAQPASPIAPGAATVQNGGFETPVQGSEGYTYRPTGASWTFALSAGIARNGTIWYSNPAPAGNQAAFLFHVSASISQVINFPAAGNYLIRLSATNAFGDSPAVLGVAMDGTAFGSVLNGAPQDNVWRSYSVPYTCTAAGNHTLSFTANSNGGSVVDDVQITANTFQVVFTPSAGGVRTATLSIANNDADENPYNITLTGTAPLRSVIGLEQPAGTPLATGKVYAWGRPLSGENNVPAGLSSVKAIAAGARSTQALKYDGTLAAWGDIVAPAGLSNLVAIDSGSFHSVALRSDGTVVTWGANTHGQLIIPTGLSGVTAIAAGDVSSAAVNNNGSNVVSWGYSTGAPPALASVVSIARGATHTLALKSDGTVVAWGENFSGEADVPPGLTGVVQIAAGGYRSIAVKSDGTVVSWGASVAPPAGLTGVIATAVGSGHGLALKSDGTITPWGINNYGQASVPPEVPGGVRAVAVGNDLDDATQGHSVALLDSIVDFGAQTSSAPGAPKTFTIRNTGDAPLVISGVTVTGPDASRFTVNTAGMATTVPAFNGQTTFSVTMTAGTTGAKHATLRVANNDAKTGPFFVHFTGIGADPDIALEQPAGTDLASGSTKTLGTGVVGASTDFTFVVRNTGTAQLNLTGSPQVALGGANAADFLVLAQPGSTIAPGAQATFTVRFAPTTPGLKVATLSIANNDPIGAENPFTLTLNATALSAAATGGWVNGGNFTVGTVGTTANTNTWPAAQSPDKAADGILSTKYLLFKTANAAIGLTPANPAVYNRLGLTTAEDAVERDPASYAIYGSATALPTTAGANVSLAGLTLITSGNLSLPDARNAGPTEVLFANSTAYASYLIVFPSVKNPAAANSTQIAEVALSMVGDTTGPAGGTMTLAPASLVQTAAALSVSFADWNDPSAPLTYAVLIDDVIVSARGAAASRNLTAPTALGAHSLKGRIYDALNNFTEVTQSFTVITALDSWRQQYFGTIANIGDGAELFDFNNNGLVNLVEFAFGLNPRSAGDNSESLPKVYRDAQGRLVIDFIRRKAATIPGVRYLVETGEDLTNWTELDLSGASVVSLDAVFEQVTVTDPVITARRFGRVRVLSLTRYVNDFATGLGAASLRGSAVWTNGAVMLTDAVNDQLGAVVVEGFKATPGMTGFTAKFQIALGPYTSDFPADGLSFAVGDLGTGAWGESGPATASNLTVGFRTSTSQIVVWVNGTIISVDAIRPYTNGAFVPVEISYDASTGLTLRYNNAAVLTNFTTPGFTFPGAGQFGFGARTGDRNQRSVVDSIEITPR